MHRGSNALLHSPYGAFSGIAAFYLGPFRSGEAAWATWVGTIRTIGTSCPSYMRNYSQEVARAATQRTRDLDNKGNNHVLLVRWHHPMLIDLPDLPILRVFREYTRRLGTRLHHVLREALDG